LTAPGPLDSDLCPDCGGDGYIADDGSVTYVIGWPIPGRCIEFIPPKVKALFAALRVLRSVILSAALSRNDAA
jgi:hypothetical protein